MQRTFCKEVGVSKVLSLVVVLLLAGCATPTTTTVLKEVKVPVPVVQPCPAPVKPARPTLPIQKLTKDSTPDQVMSAYYLSVLVLEKYAASLEAGYPASP